MAAAILPEEDGLYSINITPLVDVFLVLVIIVMIGSASGGERAIPVAVPRTAAAGGTPPEASGLALDRNGEVYLDGTPADSAAVLAGLAAEVARDPSHPVLLAADQGLPYAEVVRVLAWVRAAGVRKYALQVARPE